MRIIRMTYKNARLDIQPASPARVFAGERAFHVFNHAQDGDECVSLPVAGQATPCPSRLAFIESNESRPRCPTCGTRFRRFTLNDSESPWIHPAKGFSPAPETFAFRRTKAGKRELVAANQRATTTLVLLRPNGAWVERSSRTHVVATGIDGNGNPCPVIEVDHPAAIVVGLERPEVGAYVNLSGEWTVCDAPRRKSQTPALAAA